eukprot:COSAG06_NODE_38576_length_422_cov_0.650155_1_plen_106_part_10
MSDPSRAGARSLAFRPSHRSQFPTKRSVIATTDSPAHEAFMAPASAHPQRAVVQVRPTAPIRRVHMEPHSTHCATPRAAHAHIVHFRKFRDESGNPVPNCELSTCF